ncbi:MAG TPA: excalibur calcium-binding domain-containing protein [Mycobacteriales bacterium]|nr:excalibur calcium-binding domain-containing protein [Mycobacteriales bacterium]
MVPRKVAAPPKVPAVPYYANCAAVRAAGKAPLHRGQPGYRSGLDGDADGVACEVATAAPPVRTTPPAPPAGVYYANCAAARAAGAAPLYRGDPGYRSGLDRDGDGAACEG